MTLRKVAGLLAAFGLTVGLIGGGVGAAFQDQVQAVQNINVGTFSCGITTATPGATFGAVDALGYAHTVSYTAPTITSSVKGSAPFSFTVKNTGSIPDVLTVTESPALSAPWSYIALAPAGPVNLAAGASQAFDAGVQWDELSNANLGQKGTMTWAVNCGEAAAGGSTVIFDNTPPANGFYSPNRYYSESLGALSETQFGTQVGFLGSARNLQTATVAMSSWTCQNGGWNGSPSKCATTPGATFNVPITFNVYAVNTADNSVGALLGTKTQTFAIPYRPSADSSCPAGGQTPAGSAFKDSAGNCQNGLVSEITFTFSGQTLPNTAIFMIDYNPTGDAGSLNVMLYPSDADSPAATQPAVGTFPLPNDTYTDIGSAFHLNSAGGYGGIQPAVQFTAN